MKNICIFAAIFILLQFGVCQRVVATHIVGGEIEFTCHNNAVAPGEIRYDVTFKLYMDCVNGLPEAIRGEDTAYFYLYAGDTRQRLALYRVRKTTSLVVPPGFKNECVNNPPITCLRQNTYHFSVVLPDRPGGYFLASNNCCRNESVVNIVNPGLTGASYYVHLPERAKGDGSGVDNNSAFFTNTPPQIICINNPFIYDHSAIDPDGDSLSYEFGNAYRSETLIQGNNIQAVPSPPPYDPVVYNFGFSGSKPMAGNPPLQINPTTGFITGMPNMIGRFVVSVYCHEWRDGQLINTVIREFQFVVTNCSKAVVANIPQLSDEFNTYIVECKGYEVHFINNSVNGHSYRWDFGVPDRDDDTSRDFEPTFTYPDTGVYEVKLVVNPSSTCEDSITRLVKIFPYFSAEFDYQGNLCPDSAIQFSGYSSGTSGAGTKWSWQFGDSSAAHIQNPAHVYSKGGTYNVIFTTGNEKGCQDTAYQSITVEHFEPFAGEDTIIVQNEQLYFHAIGGVDYRWEPDIYINNPNIPNPTGYFPDTGVFQYVVFIRSERGCEGSDTVQVTVAKEAIIFVPTGFTPNGDHLNDVLRPIGIGFRDLNYFRVFNRWGQQMFYTTKFNEGWDGTWKGVPQDAGTYFWILNMVNRFGQEEIIKGDATLIR